MKYKELHKILRKAGMIELDEQRAGHPLWINPKTGENLQQVITARVKWRRGP